LFGFGQFGFHRAQPVIDCVVPDKIAL